MVTSSLSVLLPIVVRRGRRELEILRQASECSVFCKAASEASRSSWRGASEVVFVYGGRQRCWCWWCRVGTVELVIGNGASSRWSGVGPRWRELGNELVTGEE